MCEIDEVNASLNNFIKITEKRQDKLDNMIADVNKRNKEEHQVIREKQDRLSNKVSELIDSVVEYKIETSEKLGIISGKIGKTDGKAESAVKINGWLKWLIVLVVGAGLTMQGIMTTNSIQNAKDFKADQKEKSAAYKAMVDMNAKFNSFSGKALMDTINVHWQKTQAFYEKDYEPQKSWTHQKYIKEIHPNTVRSKKNEADIKVLKSIIK